MKIKLHKTQGEVFLDTSRFKVLAAGRRWGKTVLACTVLFESAIKNPEGIYWLVAPTYGQAKELAWNILMKMIPRECLEKAPNESGLIFIFKNGAEIHLKGADNPDTLRGRGLRGLVIDEVASIRNSKSVWEEILRPSLTDYEGWCLFIGTPKGKDYFWRLWLKGQRDEESYKSWQFKSEDNWHLSRSEIQQAKEQLDERFFRQEYEASFEDFTGLVYPEFGKKHIIEPFEPPKWWERVGAIDPAITGTVACLFGAIDESGAIVITGEYYEQNRRVSEVSDAIRGKCERWYIDPASQRRDSIRDGRLYSLFDEFADNGIYPLPAENDVSAGINRVAEYFKTGRLKIFSTCKNLLAELERYHWSEERETVSGLSAPKPYKAFDHAVDSLRYLIMSRPKESKEPEVRSVDRAMPLAGELLTIDDRDGGGINDWLK